MKAIVTLKAFDKEISRFEHDAATPNEVLQFLAAVVKMKIAYEKIPRDIQTELSIEHDGMVATRVIGRSQ